MMRGPKYSAMAVRDPDGEIVLEKWENKTGKTPKVFKLPVVRGMYNFIGSMVVGYKSLMRSAEISGLDDIEEEMKREKAAKKAAKKAKKSSEPTAAETETDATGADTVDAAECECVDRISDAVSVTKETEDGEGAKEDKKDKKGKMGAGMVALMIFAICLGVFLAVALFIALPAYIFTGFSYLFPVLKPSNKALASLVKSVIEGVLRIAILVAYMEAVSFMKDIRRTFQYHGAEHKTIFCYENGLELTVENVKAQRRFHPRCGTSFLIIMLLVGMIISFFIDPIYLALTSVVPNTLVRTAIKFLLIPITMGIGYELIKLAGRHDNLFTRIISAPGMWLQRLTVFEPEDDMIECAIKAFVEVIPEDDSDKF